MIEDCCRYDIRQNDTCGRYAVASKTFRPGDLIISELPFVYGPKSDCPPVCLGCHRRVNTKTLCSTCGWPVCSVQCEKLGIHADNECQVFAKVRIRFTPVKNLNDSCPQYECITPLRVLLAKERYPGVWDLEIRHMESHERERKDLDIWQVETVNVVRFLHEVCKLADRFPENLIHFACGLLETNAFASPASFENEMRYLYPRSSLLQHSCVPNVGHYIFRESETGNYRICVRAMVKIEKGQDLLLSYTQTLWPTLFRRAQLLEGKFFECCCARCSDPTELGTNLSTLKCTKCRKGWVLSTNPLDDEGPWKCTFCDFTTNGNSVRNLFHMIQNEIDELDQVRDGDPIEVREALLKKRSAILHPNNALLLTLKSSLSQLYGTLTGYDLEDLPEILLEKKLQLCSLIDEISCVIKPGLSRQRGWNLYELHGPIVKLAKNQLVRKEIDEEKLKARLNKAIKCLEEAALIFSYDDPQSPEGITGTIALNKIKNLRNTFD